MCLILTALDAHPEYALIVAANRDEFYERPTAPAAFWADAPSVLAGRDLQAGGTWLGVDRHGRFAAVTNYRQGSREPAARRSRGDLVRGFLAADTAPDEYLRQVARDADAYNGYNLIVGDSRGVWYFSNRHGPAHSLSPGIYGLSNHLLDTPWPKVATGKGTLQALLGQAEPELSDGLFRLLSDRSRPPDDLLPATGVGPEWERLLSSAFIVSDAYGTRSSTVVLVGRNGRLTFEERSFGPGGVPGERRRFELMVG